MRKVCIFIQPSFPTVRQDTLAREKMHYHCQNLPPLDVLRGENFLITGI